MLNFTSVVQDDATNSARSLSSNDLPQTTKTAQTDRSLYNKINGYQFKKQERRISNAKFAVIESILPGPHDPESLQQLYLEGKSKLFMEAEAARRAKNLIVLNKSLFDKNSQVNIETCLIE